MRQTKDAAEGLQLALIHAQLAHAAQGRVLPEQPHHHRFAVQHRDHGNTNVHFAVVNANFDATILWQALLCDVQMAKNFDPRNNGRLETFDLWRHRNVLQHAIDAIADAQLIFKGLQVNV